MSRPARSATAKLLDRTGLIEALRTAREAGRKIVFTNGCYDLLHAGHLRLLQQAAELGDVLVVALNEDDSVRRLKGEDRPLVPFAERAELLGGLRVVDWVTGFSEDTPAEIIEAVQPDVLVKGGDWAPDQIVGRDTVEARGGRVVSIPFVEGCSSSSIMERIRGSGD